MQPFKRKAWSGYRVMGFNNEKTSENPGPPGERASLEIGRSLVRALSNTRITVLYQDQDLRISWTENVPRIWSVESLLGRTDADFLPTGDAQRLTEIKRRVLKTGEPERTEVMLTDRGGSAWFQLWVDADRNSAGAIQGIITTAVETTEMKQREQTLRTLLREVSHRSKNLLAIIQSIATQTGRYSGTIDTFLARFRGRLQSLASSQDLVTSSNWRGANLSELVTGQVGRYVADHRRNIRLKGENPYLNPNAALHIGLALHELAVNSVSYGALSRPQGVVDVCASLVADGASGPVLVLTWSETIGVETSTTERRFGGVALERVVPASLNGTAQLTIADGRLDYVLSVPSGSFEIE